VAIPGRRKGATLQSHESWLAQQESAAADACARLRSMQSQRLKSILAALCRKSVGPVGTAHLRHTADLCRGARQQRSSFTADGVNGAVVTHAPSLAHIPTELTHNLSIVMPGLVPGIYVSAPQARRGWPGHKGVCARLRGLCPAMTRSAISHLSGSRFRRAAPACPPAPFRPGTAAGGPCGCLCSCRGTRTCLPAAP
jgi:hypothetical protein